MRFRGSARAGRARSSSVTAWTPTSCARQASRTRTPSSSPRTATTRTSSSARSRRSASTFAASSCACSTPPARSSTLSAGSKRSVPRASRSTGCWSRRERARFRSRRGRPKRCPADVCHRRRRRQDRRERHALAPPPRERGDADRAAARPLRTARGRIRAPGAARRRDRALRARAGGNRTTARRCARADGRRRGQHDHRPDRAGEVRRPEGDRARERPPQPVALRPARDLADDLRNLERDGARGARGAGARPHPPARAARREPRDRRGGDRRRIAVGGPEHRGALAARGLAAHLRHARRPGRDRRRLHRARGRRPGAGDPRTGERGRVTSRSSASLIALAVGGVVAALLAFLFLGRHANAAFEAQKVATPYSFAPFVSGFDSPTYVTSAPGDPTTLYVVEQVGTIRIVRDGKIAGTFLDVRNLVTSGGEQGLLSMAFSPHYTSNHLFYISYTDVHGNSRVARYRASNGRGMRSSARILLAVHQPYSNHNGGQLQFDKRGYLYFGFGDGGSEGDPNQTSQNTRTRLGKLLRAKKKTPGHSWKVVALGLRNPWRYA